MRVLKGWPSGNQGEECLQFVRKQHEFIVHRGCILLGTRIVIPLEGQLCLVAWPRQGCRTDCPTSNRQAERMVQTTEEMLQRIKGSDLARKIARLLLTQHVTPNATTGSSPAELLMGRCLQTCLDRVHPDFSHEMMVRQECKGIQIAPRRFALHDLVYAQNWGHGPKWLEAIIVKVTGPVSYIVLTSGVLRFR
ncbi:hypothetical protein PR048_017497 [Dryococelus australis]|uniref:Uncharacterized protein n=1 Tax=Dryococelus australis TaxID=614101 RepID=A0ABQ9H9R4_9NEOP|nr:hypothetical protein PR048_017497 [Dryococelus australis]